MGEGINLRVGVGVGSDFMRRLGERRRRGGEFKGVGGAGGDGGMRQKG